MNSGPYQNGLGLGGRVDNLVGRVHVLRAWRLEFHPQNPQKLVRYGSPSWQDGVAACQANLGPLIDPAFRKRSQHLRSDARVCCLLYTHTATKTLSLEPSRCRKCETWAFCLFTFKIPPLQDIGVRGKSYLN